MYNASLRSSSACVVKGFLTALEVSFKLGPTTSVERRLFALCNLIIISFQEDSNTIKSATSVYFKGKLEAF